MIVSIATTRRMLPAALVISFAMPATLLAQSAGEHIALGDRDAAALHASGALRHYEEAIKADPRSYAALWKATREAVDLGEFNSDGAERDRLYSLAETYARRAVEANPSGAEGHFNLARAIGRKALTLGKRDQVKYAGDVRTQALEALKLNPRHPGALHVMGRWNFEVMQLSGMTRFVAKKFLGGQVFDSANWEDAQRYLEESVAVEPQRLVHHLDLARVYAIRGEKDKARAQFEAAMRGTVAEYNDKRYQSLAAEELKELR